MEQMAESISDFAGPGRAGAFSHGCGADSHLAECPGSGTGRWRRARAGGHQEAAQEGLQAARSQGDHVSVMVPTAAPKRNRP